jgi:succinate-acetate transporter protein
MLRGLLRQSGRAAPSRAAVGEEGTLEGSGSSSVPADTGWKPANPAPLGLAGFAMTTFVLSFVNANWVSGTDLPVVLGLALAYGGLAQLLAGMWEFRAGNTFGAVAFSSYGAFWISYFVLVMFNVGSLQPAHAGHALGLYLWAWAIFTGYMMFAALRVNGAVLLVFVLLTVTFALLGAGNDGNNMGVVHWGGYIGVATAIVAWYASFASVINSTFGKTVAPLFPLNR